MQYVSFDYLFWVLTAYFVVRLLASENPRWWLGIGTSIGLGMMSKYSMGFFALGIVAGVLLTDARKVSGEIVTLVWSRFVSVGETAKPHLAGATPFYLARFPGNIQARHSHQPHQEFLPEQLEMTLLVPLAWPDYYCQSASAAALQMLGWMYVVPLLLFVIARPQLLRRVLSDALCGRRRRANDGFRHCSVPGAQWCAMAGRARRRCRHDSSQRCRSLNQLRMVAARDQFQGDFREELRMAELIGRIRDPRSSREIVPTRHSGGHYGEAGAINLYGPGYGLPQAISGVNSFWQRGYGIPPPETLIVLGISRGFLERNFQSCEVAGHTPNPYRIENEETSDHPDIYVCHKLRQSWPEFWKTFATTGEEISRRPTS
jgi:hypothetical protein